MQQNNASNPAASDSPPIIDAATLRSMAAAVGVNLPPERAEALLTQAEAHMHVLRTVTELDPLLAEPAGSLRRSDSNKEDHNA